VASYLTIPEITESEPLESYTMGDGGKSITVVIGMGDTAQALHRAALQATLLPLVVVATDALMFALDNVYVTSVNFSTGDPLLQLTFEAEAVRIV
jgi:hypothetical protein